MQTSQVAAVPPIWSGYFRSWEESVEAASILNSGTVASAFESNRWILRQLEMYDDAANAKFPRSSSLPQIACAVGATRIYDFGGGSGWPIELLGADTVERLETYVVIEQADVVAAMSAVDRISSTVEFAEVSTLAIDSSSAANLLYSNSAVQYVPSDEEFGDLLNRLRPEWVLLDDLQVSTGREFFSLQHYYGTYIPCRFFDEQAITQYLSQLGYRRLGTWGYAKTYALGVKPQLTDAGLTPDRIGAPVSMLLQLVKNS
jgi:putative methyltransferase (TIGR04325 family)